MGLYYRTEGVFVKKQAKKTPAVVPDIHMYRRIGTKNVWRIKGIALAAGFDLIVCMSGGYRVLLFRACGGNLNPTSITNNVAQAQRA
jgi:hypothetical protein